jgi:hypothetical protein
MRQTGRDVLSQSSEQLIESGEHLPLEDSAEQLVASLPMQLDGALANICPTGDVVDGDPPVAEAEQ